MQQLYPNCVISHISIPESAGLTTSDFTVGEEGVISLQVECLDDPNSYKITVELDDEYMDIYVHMPFVIHYQ